MCKRKALEHIHIGYEAQPLCICHVHPLGRLTVSVGTGGRAISNIAVLACILGNGIAVVNNFKLTPPKLHNPYVFLPIAIILYTCALIFILSPRVDPINMDLVYQFSALGGPSFLLGATVCNDLMPHLGGSVVPQEA